MKEWYLDQIKTLAEEAMELRRVLGECITKPGALCYSGKENERYMAARLQYISDISAAAINRITEEK